MNCHTHDHARPLQKALWIVLFFLAIEVIGGWIANSLALISDALHLFADVGALSLSLLVLHIAKKPITFSMSYGYNRAEILGALASALSLWVLCGGLIYEAIKRLLHPEPVAGPIVFIVAFFGLLANGLMFRLLHPGQSHNLNVRAAYLHVIGDLLGSLGVLLSGVILWLTNWSPIDPLLTLVFSVVILYSSGKMIRETILILMESTPSHIDPAAIRKTLLSIPGIEEVHDLHIWSLTKHKIALSCHLIAQTPKEVLEKAHKAIENQFHIRHMTIQVEEPNSFESKYCYDCKPSEE